VKLAISRLLVEWQVVENSGFWSEDFWVDIKLTANKKPLILIFIVF
jgi:uncharacterized membrane protein YqaE (UPF0057 family)